MNFDFLPKEIIFSPGSMLSYQKQPLSPKTIKQTITLLAQDYFLPLEFNKKTHIHRQH